MADAPKFFRYYDNAVPKEICRRIIEAFEKDTDGQMTGMLLGYNVRKDTKNTTDVMMTARAGAEGAKEIWGDLDKQLYNCVKESWIRYQQDEPGLDFLRFNYGLQDTGYQLQRYDPNVGKFAPHIDSGSIDSAFRIAAAVIYFNTVEVGGGTRFPQYDETVEAKEGRILWFPAGWTHVHEGLVPISGPKYIASTFMCYRGYLALDVNGPCYKHITDAIKTERLRCVPSAAE